MLDRSPKKNVVLISFDDSVAYWKYKSIFGEMLQTPNLDRICGVSTAFHAAYCQAPVCSPSRASFMSGKSPHQSGVTGSDRYYFEKISPKDMWPYKLKQAGHFCSSGGKLMQGYAPLTNDVHATIFSDKPKKITLKKRKRYFDVRGISDPVKSLEFGGFRGGPATVDEKDDRGYYDHQSAESLRSFLKNYDGKAPFYREVGFSGPHGPWTTPRRFKEMYDERNFQIPAAWNDGFDECAVMDRVAPQNIDSGRRRFWRKSVRNYFSSLTHTDYHLGRVWDAIKGSPYADDTLIIIVSDHGLHLGERNRFRKHTLWEQVANVPLIIHNPEQLVGQVVSDPVGLIDVGPTVMDYLGLPPIEGCVGHSLRPQVEGERVPDRAVPTFLGQNAGVRKGKYRFIRYDDGSTQFFDISKDWWQTKNLGPNHPDYAEMQAAHNACCKEYGFDYQAVETAQAKQPLVT